MWQIECEKRIEEAKRAGLEMGSCVAYALTAVGFDIPLGGYQQMVDSNRRIFRDGESLDPVMTVLKESGYSGWQRQSECLGFSESDSDNLRRIADLLKDGKRVILKVDYGDGRNAHFVGATEAREAVDDWLFTIGGDLRFIGYDTPYTTITMKDLWRLMTANPNYLGGPENLVYFEPPSSSSLAPS